MLYLKIPIYTWIFSACMIAMASQPASSLDELLNKENLLKQVVDTLTAQFKNGNRDALLQKYQTIEEDFVNAHIASTQKPGTPKAEQTRNQANAKYRQDMDSAADSLPLKGCKLETYRNLQVFQLKLAQVQARIWQEKHRLLEQNKKQ